MPLNKEGPACAACHRDNRPLLPLESLGAFPERAAAIRRHVIPQFFARYRSGEERLKIMDILK